jgi:hypothetical protein
MVLAIEKVGLAAGLNHRHIGVHHFISGAGRSRLPRALAP